MALLRDCDVPSAQQVLTATPGFIDTGTPSVINTAGAATYLGSDLLKGVLVRDPNGAARTDVLPTAANLVAAVKAKYGRADVGMTFACLICNQADAAETITLSGFGANGITDGVGNTVTHIIGQNASETVVFKLTNVTAASEAYTVYHH